MKRVLLIVAALCAMSVGAFAQCATMPCVVASVSLTKQTHGIPPTILLTPTTDGTFRITALLSTSKGNGGFDQGLWEVFVRWEDRIRERNSVLGGQAPDHDNDAYATIVVHDIAGKPLEYRTSIAGGVADGSQYDLFIVVEQLQ
jgi:hypothetical protein